MAGLRIFVVGTVGVEGVAYRGSVPKQSDAGLRDGDTVLPAGGKDLG
jgi:hypothetical protein